MRSDSKTAFGSISTHVVSRRKMSLFPYLEQVRPHLQCCLQSEGHSITRTSSNSNWNVLNEKNQEVEAFGKSLSKS